LSLEEWLWSANVWFFINSSGILRLDCGVHWMRLWLLPCSSYDFVKLYAENIEHTFEVHSPFFLLSDRLFAHDTFVALAKRLVDFTVVFIKMSASGHMSMKVYLVHR